MLMDTQNEFSDAQALEDTTVSTNVIDLGAEDNRAIGRELYLHVKTDATFTSGSEDGTLTVKLSESSVEAMTSSAELWESPTWAEAALTTGAVIAAVRLPATSKRYLQLAYTITGTADFDTGKVNAFLSPSLQHTFAVS